MLPPTRISARLRRTALFLLLVVLLLFPSAVAARPWEGTLDPSFDPGSGANGDVEAIAVQPDGKIIIGGAFTSYDGTARIGIARLNSNGSLDTTFNSGFPGGAGVHVYSVAVQPDGKIVIGGVFASYSGQSRNNIVRVTSTGALDATFDPGSGASSEVLAIALQPDDKVLIGGSFTTYDGATRNYVARLNEDGSLDASFSPGTGPNDRVESLAYLSDGKVMIGGYFYEVDGATSYHIARLNANGTRDSAFNPGDQLQPEWGIVYSIVPLPGGKVLVAGSFDYDYGDGFGSRSGVARLNANGNLDTTFDPGWGLNDKAHAMLRDRFGRIVLGGEFSWIDESERHGVGRIRPGGSVDANFDPGLGTGGGEIGPFVNAMALQSDGRILIAGTFTSYDGVSRNHVARVNAFGYNLYLPMNLRPN